MTSLERGREKGGYSLVPSFLLQEAHGRRRKTPGMRGGAMERFSISVPPFFSEAEEGREIVCSNLNTLSKNKMRINELD